MTNSLALGSLGSMGGLFSTTVLYSIGSGVAVGGGLALFIVALRGLPAKPGRFGSTRVQRSASSS